ncbi:MAG: class I SAM-dependent methyltransferase, partial [Promethearchaeota archaeon]
KEKAEEYDSSKWMERNQKRSTLSSLQYLIDDKLNESEDSVIRTGKSPLVLDLGCGYGRLTIPLRIQGYQICGLDLSPHLLADARTNTRKTKLDIEFKQGSMLDLPYKNETFDKIICMWLTFNHLLTKFDQVVALNEMYRVLKPGGLAIIEMINGELELIKRELQAIGRGENNRVKPTSINNIVFFFYIHNETTFRRICEQSNFQEFYIKIGEFAYEPRILGLLYK